MTPTTLEIARKFAEELVGNYDTARLILALADQVEALTAERDKYAKAADTQAMAHKVERDELQEKITAMCKAIPGYDWDGDSEKAIAGLAKERDDAVYACGLVVQRCDRLVIERDALAAAGKLALDALNLFKSSVDMYHKNGPDWTHKDGTEVFEVGVLTDHQDDIDAAIDAIKLTGVQ